jgi:hypothetical protein
MCGLLQKRLSFVPWARVVFHLPGHQASSSGDLTRPGLEGGRQDRTGKHGSVRALRCAICVRAIALGMARLPDNTLIHSTVFEDLSAAVARLQYGYETKRRSGKRDPLWDSMQHRR